MRDVSFGQYYPGDSVIHRLDPRTKILFVVVYIVSIFFVDSYTGYLTAFLMFLIIAFLSGIPLRMIFKSIKAMVFLIVFTLLLNLFFSAGTDGQIVFDLKFINFTVENQIFKAGILQLYWTSIDTAIKLALRLILLVLCPSIMTLTTTPVMLTNAIESLLSPLKLIKFPVHYLAMIMSIALRLIPNILEETDKIILAQKARCADFDSRNIFKKAKSLLPVLIPLFVSSIKRADELAFAMDARCYNGSKGRTKYKQLKFALIDIFAFFVVLVYFFVLLVLRYNFWQFGFLAGLL